MQGKRIKDVVNRMHVAMPQARDRVSRPPVIPPRVAQARAAREAGYKPSTEKDLQVQCSAWQVVVCCYMQPAVSCTASACTCVQYADCAVWSCSRHHMLACAACQILQRLLCGPTSVLNSSLQNMMSSQKVGLFRQSASLHSYATAPLQAPPPTAPRLQPQVAFASLKCVPVMWDVLVFRRSMAVLECTALTCARSGSWRTTAGSMTSCQRSWMGAMWPTLWTPTLRLSWPS